MHKDNKAWLAVFFPYIHGYLRSASLTPMTFMVKNLKNLPRIWANLALIPLLDVEDDDNRSEAKEPVTRLQRRGTPAEAGTAPHVNVREEPLKL